jgi:hypothetical protein
VTLMSAYPCDSRQQTRAAIQSTNSMHCLAIWQFMRSSSRSQCGLPARRPVRELLTAAGSYNTYASSLVVTFNTQAGCQCLPW